MYFLGFQKRRSLEAVDACFFYHIALFPRKTLLPITWSLFFLHLVIIKSTVSMILKV